jgi:hypothetical protein
VRPLAFALLRAAVCAGCFVFFGWCVLAFMDPSAAGALC